MSNGNRCVWSGALAILLLGLKISAQETTATMRGAVLDPAGRVWHRLR